MGKNNNRDSFSNNLATTSTEPLSETDYEECLIDGIPESCSIIIIGASGDLTTRKIIPALFNLYLCDALPESFIIVGCARTEMSDQDFRDRMREALESSDIYQSSKWEEFAHFLHYKSIEYNDRDSFIRLSDFLQNLQNSHGEKDNRLFYFAIPPTLYQITTRMIGEAGLSAEEKGWTRIVVEKPFGRDLESAIDLDRVLHEFFKEHQIFRIDHYLAKESVQNILMFRFANSIFEPVWNRRYIDNISITVAESMGVGHRAGYYEQAGVLRDMFQNHMMQLLALTAMEPPSLFEADRIRDEKVKVYRALRPFSVDHWSNYLVLGQYTQGVIEGRIIPGYREEPGVSPESLTPTFAMMKVFLDNWRWQGVPFYLTSGKGLSKKITEISIQFKEIPHSMFRKTLGDKILANKLILGIYPKEKITLTFQTKSPGAKVALRSVKMDFNYRTGYHGPNLEAYEKVLLDCMLGDHMLFWRQDGVELCWSFLTPILNRCETCGERADKLYPYKAGTWGPDAVKEIK